MSAEAKIIGFDRSSELLAVELDVPSSAVDRVKKIADVPLSDPDLLGSCPLDEQQLARIAEAAHMAIDPSKFLYFLEAYDA